MGVTHWWKSFHFSFPLFLGRKIISDSFFKINLTMQMMSGISLSKTTFYLNIHVHTEKRNSDVFDFFSINLKDTIFSCHYEIVKYSNLKEIDWFTIMWIRCTIWFELRKQIVCYFPELSEVKTCYFPITWDECVSAASEKNIFLNMLFKHNVMLGFKLTNHLNIKSSTDNVFTHPAVSHFCFISATPLTPLHWIR